MHAIHIGIRSDDDIVEPQSFITFFYIQRVLQQVKLLVFIHDLLGKPETVQRFSPQTEYGLCFNVPGLGNGTARRITFGNEYGALFLFFNDLVLVFAGGFVIVMEPAVA
jgi:hypothetical protein